LDHISDSAAFTLADIDPVRSRLADMRAIVQKDKLAGETPESIMQLITNKLDMCDAAFQELTDRLSALPPELSSIQQKLVSIKRQMAALASRKTFNPAELSPLIDELRAIDAQRVNGRFISKTGDLAEGQEIVTGLLDECFTFAHDLKAEGGNLNHSLRPIYDRLADLKSQLERMTLTHRWTFRETDLYYYQSQLAEIDSKRGTSGKFEDDDGNVGESQTVLLYMLRRCYALLYQLLNSSVPVSEGNSPDYTANF
jgi:chromosome segregation ATPase